jgi:hypothetical protein
MLAPKQANTLRVKFIHRQRFASRIWLVRSCLSDSACQDI